MKTVSVIVGVISRAHGIKGEVNVDLRTDEPQRRFTPGVVLKEESGKRKFTVETCRMHSGRLLVSFAEAPDRTAVEALRGVVLTAQVPVDEVPQDSEEFYDRQLLGLKVKDYAGQIQGEIIRVNHSGPQDLLVIKNMDGEERLIPFVQALVPIIDIPAGFIQLADVDGLLWDIPED